jgi:hypothetical protein
VKASVTPALACGVVQAARADPASSLAFWPVLNGHRFAEYKAAFGLVAWMWNCRHA